MPAAACCCLLLPAAACCLLLPAAVPTKIRPSRTGKHHGPEGRTESKIKFPRKSLLYVSRCAGYWELLLLLGQTLQKGGFRHHATGGRQRLLLLLCPQRHGPPGRGNTMALKDEQGPKYAFPGAGTSLLKSPIEKACYTFLDAGYWELLLLLLTLQKGGFRQGNPMLLKGDSDCCCCSFPDGETPWP